MATHTLNALDSEFGQRWIAQFVTTFAEFRERLSDLDRLAGDGDFGTNLNSALGRAEEALAASPRDSFSTVFAAVSTGFLRTGGTSGPLFGMWFREISAATEGPEAGLQQLAAGVTAGVAKVMRLGKASVGDNTMVDALVPTAAALTASAAVGETLAQGLYAAALAARSGAESTAGLTASKGRASYVGELAQGVLDPGAVAVALLFQAGSNALGEQPALDWQLS